jgi:hypothetical protein
MAGLQFSYRQLYEDLQAIEGITRGFVEQNASLVFRRLEEQLEAARRASAGSRCALTILANHPLRTMPSEKEYELAPRRGKHRIVAEVSAVWDLTPIGPHQPRNIDTRVFELTGKASVLTLIREIDGTGTPFRELARWRTEFGVHDSPGAHFHLSVLGHKEAPPFPHSLSVPRFPSMLITIGDALEFVLGEIFQARWARHAAEDSASMSQWRRSQQDRLIRVLTWQQSVISRAVGAPWTALKVAKPRDGLFTE